MSRDIFLKDSKGNTLFKKWGIFGKAIIVNDLNKQEKIRKVIKNAGKFFHNHFANFSIWEWILLILFIPEFLFLNFIPIVLILLIVGGPLFFILHYFIPTVPIFYSFLVSLFFAIGVLVRDYSKSIDKIINEKDSI